MKIVTLNCETTIWPPKSDPRWEHPWRMPLAVLGMEVNFDKFPKELVYIPSPNIIVICNREDTIDHDYTQFLINEADYVISFNGEHFDFAVLEGAGFDMSRARSVSYDLMAKFQAVSGHRINLADFAEALGVQEKIGPGENAAMLWQAAQFLAKHQAANTAGAKHLYRTVIDYCLTDVAITRQCFDILSAFNGRMQYWQKFKRQYREVRLELPEWAQSIDNPPCEFPEKDDNMPIPDPGASKREPGNTFTFTDEKGKSHNVPF